MTKLNNMNSLEKILKTLKSLDTKVDNILKNNKRQDEILSDLTDDNQLLMLTIKKLKNQNNYLIDSISDIEYRINDDEMMSFRIEEGIESGQNKTDPSKLINKMILQFNQPEDEQIHNRKNKEEEEGEEEEELEYDSDIEYDELDYEINNISDLIKLGELYPKLKEEHNKMFGTSEVLDNKTDVSETKVIATVSQNENNNEKKAGVYQIANKKFPLNLEKIYNLQKPLMKLENMIGMSDVKESVFNQLIFILHDFIKTGKHGMLHTIITGPPGVGKTELGKILTDIFAAAGVIKGNKIKIARRSDIVSKYAGHTAPNIEKLINDCDVLFIDEAYSLGSGNNNEKDTFSVEAINTLNQLLSEEKDNFVCIIAGYEDELNKSIFSVNPGLKRRFQTSHHIDGYSPLELAQIYSKMINEKKWHNQLDEKTLETFFSENKEMFPHYAGDIESFIKNCMEYNARRTIVKNLNEKRKISNIDLEEGLKIYVKNRKYKEKDISYYRFYT